jgi:hypothetical protein
MLGLAAKLAADAFDLPTEVNLSHGFYISSSTGE